MRLPWVSKLSRLSFMKKVPLFFLNIEPQKRTWPRFVALAVLLVALYVVGKMTGVIDSVDISTVRQRVDGAGALGVVIFVAIFAIGELLHVPGLVFVCAGLLAWGKILGYGISMLGALVSVSLSFFVVRAVGGRALASVERPFLKKMLARLDSHPIQTVFFLRLLLILAPPLNYGLALTCVRYRDYLVGSALGLAIPLALVALLLDWVVAKFF
jgi:uncharacterized membrane protein YdjX (TVP38/TMEM64 family)